MQAFLQFLQALMQSQSHLKASSCEPAALKLKENCWDTLTITWHILPACLILSSRECCRCWRAAFCATDEGPQMTHRNLLNERRAVFSEMPPLKHLSQEKKAPGISLGDTFPT